MDQTSIDIDMDPSYTIEFAGTQNMGVVQKLWADQEYDCEQAHFAVQKNAYCDGRVMEEWIEEVWLPDVHGPSVLLPDCLKVYKMERVRVAFENCHTKLEFVPPGAIGLCQPMDVSAMKLFKPRCPQLYLELATTSGFCAELKSRRKRIASIVTTAWEEVSVKTIIAGFNKAKLICTVSRDALGHVELEQPPPDYDH